MHFEEAVLAGASLCIGIVDISLIASHQLFGMATTSLTLATRFPTVSGDVED